MNVFKGNGQLFIDRLHANIIARRYIVMRRRPAAGTV